MTDSKQGERPIGQALLVCDHIIVEEGTNKKSLIGVFNNIGSSNFPVIHPQMSVFAAMTNGRSTLPTKLRFIREGDQKEIFAAEGMVEFQSPNAVVELVFKLVNVPFEQAGLYTFELYCDEELILEKRFNVVAQ